MVDISAIAGVASSLKTAAEMAQALVGIRDARVFMEKSVQLNQIITAAQQSAIDAQANQLALINRVNDLEKEIMGLKAWDAEKETYELHECGPGTFAYTKKKMMRGTEPVHLLCANCFNHGQKSFLQATMRLEMRRRIYVCHACKAEIAMTNPYPTAD